MSAIKTKKLTLLAILTALTVILGRFVMIPTPTGFLTLLDAGIYFTAFYLGSGQAAIVGGLSAFLVDMLAGYPQWMFLSLLAHGGQGYFAGLPGKKRLLGLCLASLVMLGIYFLGSIILGQGFGAALAGLAGNIGQNFSGMLIGYLVYIAFRRVEKNH